ncbi:MAG: F-box-like [Chlamydiales bacterium]|jgi:WD40 repeat protein|nr:F-box-like [Chlamydiales bacterium]
MLPDEVMIHLFSYLPVHDLYRASSISSRWRVIASDPLLFQRRHIDLGQPRREERTSLRDWVEHKRLFHLFAKGKPAFSWYYLIDKKFSAEEHLQTSAFAEGELMTGCLDKKSKKPSIKIWDLKDGVCLARLKTKSAVTALICSKKFLFAASHPGSIEIWDLSSRQRIETLFSFPNAFKIKRLFLSAQEEMLFALSINQVLRIYPLDEGKKSLELHLNAQLLSLVSFEGLLYCGLSNSSTCIWHLGSGQCIEQIKTSSLPTALARFNNCLLMGFSDGSLAMREGKILFYWPAHDSRVTLLHLFGNLLISGSADGTLKVSDLQSRQVIGTLPDSWMKRLGSGNQLKNFHIFGPHICSVHSNAILKKWDVSQEGQANPVSLWKKAFGSQQKDLSDRMRHTFIK